MGSRSGLIAVFLFAVELGLRAGAVSSFLPDEEIFMQWKAYANGMETAPVAVPSALSPRFGLGKSKAWTLEAPTVPQNADAKALELEFVFAHGLVVSERLAVFLDGGRRLSQVEILFVYERGLIKEVICRTSTSKSEERISISYNWKEDEKWSTSSALNALSIAWIIGVSVTISMYLFRLPKAKASPHRSERRTYIALMTKQDCAQSTEHILDMPKP
ncbi:hypothetical protein NDN08_001511 [Rhodosorus marinus]|uniref:Uncharacterized protein n=1 Tax=Rhodosorus marinus TaxID=101924 RepID=A0AAV8UR06_9RHOD|nr:hypothetical protein NDN08_001511 [Rhodosorus marinus]